MDNPFVRHNAPRVLTLEFARPVRRVTSVPNVVKHAQVVVLVDVHLTQGRVLLVGMDHMDRIVRTSAHICAVILVAIRTELASNAL